MNTLYEKLQLAARNNMSAEEVKIMIGETPILDTKHERDKKALLMADFELDKVSGITFADMKKSPRVIYWKIADKQHQATIAGLAWPKNGKSVFFSGKILDP